MAAVCSALGIDTALVPSSTVTILHLLASHWFTSTHRLPRHDTPPRDTSFRHATLHHATPNATDSIDQTESAQLQLTEDAARVAHEERARVAQDKSILEGRVASLEAQLEV